MTKVPAGRSEYATPKAKTQLRVFGNKPFMRFARKFRASSQDLWNSHQEEPDADLGGGVFKFRLARKGEGNRGGARSMVAMKEGERIVMMFGFEKKDLANIDDKELKAFKKLAKIYLKYSEEEINQLVQIGELVEIKAPPAGGVSQAKAKCKTS